ncbi:MAG: immunoglobulin-like domain-containing protein [Bacteroidia bacterium]
MTRPFLLDFLYDRRQERTTRSLAKSRHLSSWLRKLIFILIVSGFCSELNAQIEFTLGTGSAGSNTGTSYPAPYGNYWWGAKHQFLIREAEMTSAGATSGDLDALGFNVVGVEGTALQNFTIRIQHTTQTALTSWTTSGWTTVFNASSYTEELGWNMHEFSSPFSWNGSDNILIEVCFNNGSFTNNALTAWDTYSYNASIEYHADLSGVCASTNTSGTHQNRPQIRFQRFVNDDVRITAFLGPASGCNLGTNENLEVTVRNTGLNNMASGDTIPFGYTINGGSVERDTMFLTSALSSGSTRNFTFSNSEDLSTAGEYDIVLWTEYRPDLVPANDTINVQVTKIPFVNTFPYTEGFESGRGGWTTSGTDRWEWGSPAAGITSAASGTQAWMTDLDGDYQNNDEAYLISPCFDFSEMRIPFLAFFLNFDTETNWDGLEIQASTDNVSWNKIGATAPGFYNNTSAFGNLAPPKWSGNSSGWQEYRLSLRDLTGEPYVRFRFHFSSDGSVSGYPGTAMDSFRVIDSCSFATGISPLVDFSVPDTIYTNSPTTFLNTYAEQIKFNYGSHNWYVDGSHVSSQFDLRHTFTAAGQYDLKLVTRSCWGLDSSSQTITVHNPTRKPEASFIGDKNLVEIFETVQLTDLSLYGPSSWEWIVRAPTSAYFWISGTEFSQNPGIAFNDPGIYSICLVATNASGSDTICNQDYIVVKGSQNMCVFPFSTEVPSGNLYDDGGPNIDYGAGHNGINLCAFLIEPCASAVILQLNEFDLAGGDYLRVYDGEDATGIPLWNTGSSPNGMTGQITNASVVDSLVANSGKMYIEFETDNSTATIDAGFAAEWSTIPGNFTPPVADFTATDTTCVGIPTSFENLSTGQNLTYSWDVNNDGIPESSARNLTYSFSSTGIYNVRMRVTNCGGSDSMVNRVVVVIPNRAPGPRFAADILRPNVGEIVQLTDTSSYCVSDWTWTITPSTFDFENGTDEHSVHPEISFNAPGQYTVKLMVSNASASDSLTKTNYIEVVNYCTPAVSNLNADVGISRVSLGTINNSTLAGASNYTDYTATHSTTLEKGGRYGITLERATNNNSMSREAWIDFNQDGDFDEVTESIALETGAKTLSFTDSFTVPASALTGATRMRVGAGFGNQTTRPCGPHQFGEFEDYRIIISPDITPPVIDLIGADTVRLAQCDPYNEDSAVVTDNVDGIISSSVNIDNSTINTCQVDTFYVTYNATDASGNAAIEVIRVVIITEDTVKPVLTLSGQNPDTIEVHTTYTEPGYSASDNLDGNITSDVVVTGSVDTAVTGSYQLTYTVSDAQGNTAVETRTVVVMDRTAPVVTLNGPAIDTIELCLPYNDSGATASDNYDASVNIIATGEVDTIIPGTYILDYCATDDAGNGPACISRTVVVVDETPPAVALIGEDTLTIEVYTSLDDPGLTIDDGCNEDYTVTTGGDWTGTADDRGCFTLWYFVTDASGNSDSISRTICVVDETAPAIRLIGDPVIYLERWEVWNDPEAEATDNFDPNPEIIIGGNFVNTQLEGDYFITYQAEDMSGNLSEEIFRLVKVTEPTTGIDSENLSNSVELFPNPNSGRFNLRLGLANEEHVRISILNTLGQELQVVEDATIASKDYSIDLSTERSGIYFVRIQAGSQTVMKKVTINR